eukprot:jgi/Tetstr1/436347/TSEL_025183.t2
MRAKGRSAGAKAKQGKARRRDAPSRKTFPGLPTVVDVTVRMPDGQKVELRGVSTDMLADLRMLISQRPEFSHLTHYAFSHPTRGILPDSQQVASLKDSELDMVLPEYTREKALEHIRHLMSLSASTTMLGPRTAMKEPQDTERGNTIEVAKYREAPTHARNTLEIVADVGDFFSFFSLQGLQCPIKSIALKNNSEAVELAGGDKRAWELRLHVVLSSDEQIEVVASAPGFRLASGGDAKASHTLVELLQVEYGWFADGWAALVAGMQELYPEGNPPTGLLANAWLVPPCMAADPASPMLLPAEDPALGAPNLGCSWGRRPGQGLRNWAAEFRNAEQQLRDPEDILKPSTAKAPSKAQQSEAHRRLFLAHCAYTDTAIVEAVEAAAGGSEPEAEVRYSAGLVLGVSVEDAVVSPARSRAGSRAEAEAASVASILRGLASHDPVAAAVDLSSVTVYHRGRVVIASPHAEAPCDGSGPPRLEDEPAAADCGAASLKLNSLRWLLHTGNAGVAKSSLPTGEALLAQALSESGAALGTVRPGPPPLRWELAVTWASFLKNPPAEGPGALQPPSSSGLSWGLAARRAGQLKPGLPGGSAEGEEALREALGPHAWAAVAKLGIGLHRRAPDDLAARAADWYSQVALRRAVWELRRLEVAPVDGTTLTEFLHSRGINMRHLGRLVTLTKEEAAAEAVAMSEGRLVEAASAAAAQRGVIAHPNQLVAEASARQAPRRQPGSMAHIVTVCQVDMVARALKHLLRAIVVRATRSSPKEGEQGAAAAAGVAAALNAALGSSQAAHSGELWAWLRVYVLQRYQHALPSRREAFLPNPAILLRAVCQKVGIELAARSYNFSGAAPVSPADVVALVPVVKAPAPPLAEARNLLDGAKADMDSGRLDAAAAGATRAALLLSELAGAHHRLAAGAYSLLAVVLYHTGDFLQAAYYQQKALIINERALGLDHPDTLKSYGDLAVFYYRLQSHELALRYELRCTHMLGLACGTAHPNTAATYINIAMMQEGLGRSGPALRFLHAALQLNTALLGSDHVQTAASYHAMAIALSLMEPPLYSLSATHEHTCWETLERQLGASNIRTQDAAAWLDYFDHKAAQQAALRGAEVHLQGLATRASEKSIASKGHLPVKDLMQFIGEAVGQPAAENDEDSPAEDGKLGGSLSSASSSASSLPAEAEGLPRSAGEKVALPVPSPVSVLSETEALALIEATDEDEEAARAMVDVAEALEEQWTEVQSSRAQRGVSVRRNRPARHPQKPHRQQPSQPRATVSARQLQRCPPEPRKEAPERRDGAAEAAAGPGGVGAVMHEPMQTEAPPAVVAPAKEAVPADQATDAGQTAGSGPPMAEDAPGHVEAVPAEPAPVPVPAPSGAKKSLDPSACEFVPVRALSGPPPGAAPLRHMPMPVPMPLHPRLQFGTMPQMHMPLPHGGPMGGPPPMMSMPPGAAHPHPHWAPPPWMPPPMYMASPNSPPGMMPMPQPPRPGMPPMSQMAMGPPPLPIVPPTLAPPPPMPYSPPPPPPPRPNQQPSSPQSRHHEGDKPNAGRQLLALLNRNGISEAPPQTAPQA